MRPDEEFLSLLQELDDPVRAEAPEGFDHGQAEARFQRFSDTLRVRLNSPTVADQGVQDASFHGEIRLLESPPQVTCDCWIRTSNFGRLCSLWDLEKLALETHVAVLETMERHGYVFVPAHVLEGPYTGSNPGVSGFETWALRFFDYI